MDSRGGLHPEESNDALLQAIADDESGRVMLVWTEKQTHLVLPEELKEAEVAVRAGRTRRINAEANQTRSRLCWSCCLLAGLGLYEAWRLWGTSPSSMGLFERLASTLQGLLTSTLMGMSLLLWFFLVCVPWYDARKQLHLWNREGAGDSSPLIATLRFDTWLMIQRAPLTRILAVCMLVVWLVQMHVGDAALHAAGLIKPLYHAGEYWRLLTAPWLHGNLVHFLFNLLALLYLGKRVELFARWPHLLIVLLFSSLAGGILSANFLKPPSVGISGGLMGWLGFLLVFETLHRKLVTRSARRRLLAGVLLTALMGVIGYRLIDNAAHLGGLLAGMAYGWIVFPSSASIHRPKVLAIDRLAGLAAATFLVLGLGFVLVRLLQIPA